jgi:hypothetical protein
MRVHKTELLSFLIQSPDESAAIDSVTLQLDLLEQALSPPTKSQLQQLDGYLVQSGTTDNLAQPPPNEEGDFEIEELASDSEVVVKILFSHFFLSIQSESSLSRATLNKKNLQIQIKIIPLLLNKPRKIMYQATNRILIIL